MTLYTATITETVSGSELFNAGIALPISKASATTNPNQGTAKSLSPTPTVTYIGS